MKKTFTILFSVGMALSAAAQHGYQSGNAYSNKNEKTVAFTEQHTNAFESSAFARREKERQLKEIDKKFDRKIDQVKKDRHMGRREKSMQIKMLEDQRSKEIRQAEFAFDKNNHKYDDGRNNNHKW